MANVGNAIAVAVTGAFLLLVALFVSSRLRPRSRDDELHLWWEPKSRGGRRMPVHPAMPKPLDVADYVPGDLLHAEQGRGRRKGRRGRSR